MTEPRTVQAQEIQARSIRDTLESTATAAGVAQVAVAVVVAAVATSRAANHTLSPVAVVGLVGGWAATLAAVGWPRGVYDGADSVLAGAVKFDDEPIPSPRWSPDHAAVVAERGGDGFSTASLWRASLVATVIAAGWAVMGAGLVATVLDGRHANLLVVAAALAGLAGTSSVIVDTLGRRHGMAAARRALASGPARIEPLRRRAWRQVALPIALIQGAVNGAGTWVLFHSYHRASAAGAGGAALTNKVAVADAIVILLVLGTLFTVVGGTWGRVDVALGRVSTTDIDGGGDGSRKVGAQAVGYTAVLLLLLAKLEQILLPGAPNLIEVGIARAVLAGLMAYLATGFAYVRGALNAQPVERVSA